MKPFQGQGAGRFQVFDGAVGEGFQAQGLLPAMFTVECAALGVELVACHPDDRLLALTTD